MLETKPRPVFLNLMKIRLPIAGIMSIIHRVTGVVMVISIPVAIYLFGLSLSSASGFADAREFLQMGLVQLLIFLFLWGLMHHLLAGIRYLLIDIDIGVDKPVFRQTAWAVMVAAPVLALILMGGLS
ncbi:MAG: succinate dehydrogenase, cytochrome b556 subunit [Candidatus Thiodiazotropha sp.]